MIEIDKGEMRNFQYKRSVSEYLHLLPLHSQRTLPRLTNITSLPLGFYVGNVPAGYRTRWKYMAEKITTNSAKHSNRTLWNYTLFVILHPPPREKQSTVNTTSSAFLAPLYPASLYREYFLLSSLYLYRLND